MKKNCYRVLVPTRNSKSSHDTKNATRRRSKIIGLRLRATTIIRGGDGDRSKRNIVKSNVRILCITFCRSRRGSAGKFRAKFKTHFSARNAYTTPPIGFITRVRVWSYTSYTRSSTPLPLHRNLFPPDDCARYKFSWWNPHSLTSDTSL